VNAAIGVSLDRVRIPVARARVADAVRAVLRSERVRDAMISVAFVPTREIQRMNRAHLRRNRPTDVIAFGFHASGRGAPIVGDIYIAPDVALHGTLHVLGHDHPETDARTRSPMWRKQERLVARLARS
jgi:probable rRNA maturation factor